MDTEQKLIAVIVEHYLEGRDGRLTVSDVSERAGISRQSFNRYYKHLKDYAIGKKSVSEIIPENYPNIRGLLAKSRERIVSLHSELSKLKKVQAVELKRVESSYITTLMNSDITLKESDEVRITLEKQALHNDLLVKKNQVLELKLTVQTAKISAAGYDATVDSKSKVEKIVLDADFSQVFKNYARVVDQDAFEMEKDAILSDALKRINKFTKHGNTRIVIFIEMYISSFEKFVDDYVGTAGFKYIIVKVPIHCRIELNMFCRKILNSIPIEVCIPYCDAEPTIKAQRAFLFRNVPAIELDAVEKLQIPLMKNGFSNINQFRVCQGD